MQHSKENYVQKITIKTILLIAGLTACGIATAGGRETPPAAHDCEDRSGRARKVLIITGRWRDTAHRHACARH